MSFILGGDHGVAGKYLVSLTGLAMGTPANISEEASRFNRCSVENHRIRRMQRFESIFTGDFINTPTWIQF